MTRFMLAAAAALAALPAAAHAQAAAGVTGTFVFEQNLRFRDSSGGLAETKGEVHLTLEQHGDSIVGTWQIHAEGRAIKPMELRGTVSNGVVRLRSGTQQAHLQGGGGERSIETYQEYVLTIRGNEISGSIHTYSTDANVEIPPRDITGKRKA